MKSINLVCSNCDSHLCDVYFYENNTNVYKIIAKCPCGDKSMPKYVDCVKYSPVAGDNYKLDNVEQLNDSKEVIIYVSKKTVR